MFGGEICKCTMCNKRIVGDGREIMDGLLVAMGGMVCKLVDTWVE